MTEEQIRAWLLKYAWMGDAESQAREVECIMSQDDWKYLDARIDRTAGHHESGGGPEAVSDATGYELSALYECHSGPHLPTCPITS